MRDTYLRFVRAICHDFYWLMNKLCSYFFPFAFEAFDGSSINESNANKAFHFALTYAKKVSLGFLLILKVECFLDWQCLFYFISKNGGNGKGLVL